MGRGTQEEQLHYLTKIKAEHVQVYQSIQDGDVVRARAAMRRHLSNGLARLRTLEEGILLASSPADAREGQLAPRKL